jgi:superfamily II helicase
MNTNKKNVIKLIENYLLDENDIMAKNKLDKAINKGEIIGFTNNVIHKSCLIKKLKILKEQLYVKKNEKIHTEKRNGLYHERFKNSDTSFNDEYDIFSMDCIESPFCMKHKRYGEKTPSYKYHYCCKYNNKINIPIENNNKYNLKWVSNKFVCFNCQKISKRYENKNKYQNIYKKWPKCSDCNKYMESVGVEFTPPSKNDKKKWDKLNKEWYKHSRMTYQEYNLLN